MGLCTPISPIQNFVCVVPIYSSENRKSASKETIHRKLLSDEVACRSFQAGFNQTGPASEVCPIEFG
jgi:hypothetical protein